MAYTLNIPQASDLISDSQVKIRDNFNQANTSFGIDHYAFADTTGNNGFHNRVTQPSIVGGVHPVTTTNPIIYAIQDGAGLGVLQYSRGPVYTDANGDPPYSPCATPITSIMSPSAPFNFSSGVTYNIVDFTGVTQYVGTLYVMNYAKAASGTKFAIFDFMNVSGSADGMQIFPNRKNDVNFTATSTGDILQLTNSAGTLNRVFWTVVMHRINV